MEKSRVQEMKKDIINTFIYYNKPITRHHLLSLISGHQVAYKNGIITYGTLKELNQAIKEIWENEFNTIIDLETNYY